PTPLQNGFVEALLDCERAGIAGIGNRGLSEGDTVRVLCGPFVNYLATIASLPEKNRIHVVFDMMGRQVDTSVSASDVELVETRNGGAAVLQ
ncbi:MAG: hypothetical protein WBA25_18095, partial [Jannaschia sp.]